MTVLKATQAQYETLNGHTYKVSKLEFTKDANNNWVVGREVLHNGNFADIKPQLLELEEIEFEPIIEQPI